MRASTRAGVRALLGRAFGVLGLADGGLGEEALPLGVIGEAARRAKGLGLQTKEDNLKNVHLHQE